MEIKVILMDKNRFEVFMLEAGPIWEKSYKFFINI